MDTVFEPIFDKTFAQPKARRIALLGGAFDPPHWDHLRLAQGIASSGRVDELWLMPCPDVRWDKSTRAPAELRLAMCRGLVQGTPIQVSDFEIRQGEYRGGKVLMERLQKAYPEVEFVWVLGTDAWNGLLSWRDPLHFATEGTNGHLLIPMCEWLVVERLPDSRSAALMSPSNNPNDLDLERYQELGARVQKWSAADLGLQGLSSTTLREALASALASALALTRTKGASQEALQALETWTSPRVLDLALDAGLYGAGC